MSTFRIGVLAFARGLVGVSTLITPIRAAPLFGVPLTPEASVLGRLFGSRDLVLAAYLWRAYSNYRVHQGVDKHLQTPLIGNIVQKEQTDGSFSQKEYFRRDLGRALWLGIWVDGIDVMSSVVCILEGNLSDLGKIEALGGAMLLASLGYWQLRVLQREQESPWI